MYAIATKTFLRNIGIFLSAALVVTGARLVEWDTVGGTVMAMTLVGLMSHRVVLTEDPPGWRSNVRGTWMRPGIILKYYVAMIGYSLIYLAIAFVLFQLLASLSEGPLPPEQFDGVIVTSFLLAAPPFTGVLALTGSVLPTIALAHKVRPSEVLRTGKATFVRTLGRIWGGGCLFTFVHVAGVVALGSSGVFPAEPAPVVDAVLLYVGVVLEYAAIHLVAVALSLTYREESNGTAPPMTGGITSPAT